MKKIVKIAILICICLVFLILSYKVNKLNHKNFQDDLIFFKLLKLKQNSIINENYKENKESIEKLKSNNEYKTKEIIFNMAYKGSFYKNVNLKETINPKTLVNEKIAPGTNGEFEIKITSNEEVEYNIRFISKNIKPKNLKFSTDQSDKTYDKLEDMNDDLKGIIKKQESKSINIIWEWRYENGYIENKQDTSDGMNIKQYNFIISAIVK